MPSNGQDGAAHEWSGARPHEDFVELCALSTSGDLSEEERRELEAHVADCAQCREAIKQFEATVDLGVPQLVSQWNAESAHPNEGDGRSEARKRAFAFAHGNGHRKTSVSWNHVWLPFAACIVLSLALATYTYRVGKGHRAEVVSKEASTVSPSSDQVRVDTLERELSDAAHERQALNSQANARDQLIADLRKQITEESASLDEMKAAQANLKQSVATDEQAKQQLTDERNSLAEKLDAAESSVREIEGRLVAAEQQRSNGQTLDTSLTEQIKDLNAELRDREQTINKQDDLLEHDRDIRDLMGARDLYIAEVYDVGRDAATQKPCGRVFYTKGKSLVFYAYDLDKQPGVRDAKTFQAWGRRGADMHEALNLGILYEDSAAKKRWVLKFDDPKTLEQIDAVFVTVEPNGPSHKPSGKPLLFAYLKIDPNHP